MNVLRRVHFLFLILLVLSFDCFAGLNLEINVIHKRGIDKGLVITSELHSLEAVDRDRNIKLRMKNGITLFLNARFVKKEGAMGPSDLIQLYCELRDMKDDHLKTYEGAEMNVPLGQEKKLIFDEKTGHLVEVSIKPYLDQ